MASSVTKVKPLKLPSAPDDYSRRDQDHTRRLIEMAFAEFAAGIQQTSLQLREIATLGRDFIPQSPIHGQAWVIARIAGALPVCQLLNPVNSGVYLVVHEARITSASGGMLLCARITDGPTNLQAASATVTTSGLFRRNEYDATTIVATLQATNDAATPLPAGGTAQFLDAAVTTIDSFYQAVNLTGPGEQPIILRPGEALECYLAASSAQATTGAADGVGMYVAFDQIAVPVFTTTTDFRQPVTSVMSAAYMFPSATGGIVQLLNPSSSGKKIKVTNLWIAGNAPVNNPLYIRRTSNPQSLQGVPNSQSVFGIATRLDQRDSGVVGQFAAMESTGGSQVTFVFSPAQAFWFDLGSVSGASTLPLHRLLDVGTYPIVLKPGSALEFRTMGTTAGGNPVYVVAKWDEVNI